MTDKLNIEDLKTYTAKINDLINELTYYKEQNRRMKIHINELQKYKDNYDNKLNSIIQISKEIKHSFYKDVQQESINLMIPK